LGKFMVYYIERKAKIPQKLVLTGDSETTQYGRVHVKFNKTAGNFACKVSNTTKIHFSLVDQDHDPYFKKSRRPWKSENVYRLWDENIQMGIEDENLYNDFLEQKRKLRLLVRAACNQLQEVVRQIWLEEQHKEFLKEYEDDEDGSFWEMYKDDLEETNTIWRWFDDVLDHLIERDIEFVGMKVKDIISLAEKHGCEPNDRYKEEMDKVKDVVIQELEMEDEDDC
jgi:hypothetical protein